MMQVSVEKLKVHWNDGLVVAFVSLIESMFKFSFASTELVLGHFRNATPNETRIFIHSVLFTVLGLLGIVCSCFLYSGLTNSKKYNRIIYWICLQGISIFHQAFFSIELVLIVHRLLGRWSINFTVILALLLLMSAEIKFLVKIVVIYQRLEEKEAPPCTPRVVSAWRIPTVSELLGDEGEMGSSNPPVWTLTNASNNNNNNESNA